MFKYFVYILILLASCSVHSKDVENFTPLEFPVPVLSPKEAVELAENYVVKVRKIDKNMFRLSGVRFEYFSTILAPPGVLSVGWSIDFECVPTQIDCEFSVRVSNSAKPKLAMYPAR
ncbi:MAG: hypothetical protein V4447_03870 [Pseudomonadota bacterium]